MIPCELLLWEAVCKCVSLVVLRHRELSSTETLIFICV